MLQPPLTPVEARVLGCLLEKEATTPDLYPLSLSALVAACNQTSNREPVMRLDDDTVTDAVVALRRRGLLRAMQPAGSRVTKYNHLLADVLDLDRPALALLGVLLLRGAQTPGELRTRSERWIEFTDLPAVETALDALIARTPEPLVARLPRRPGQKEVRYVHLLAGAPADDAGLDAPAPTAAAGDARIAALEATVDALRAELAALRDEFAAFRAQFQ